MYCGSKKYEVGISPKDIAIQLVALIRSGPDKVMTDPKAGRPQPKVRSSIVSGPASTASDGKPTHSSDRAPRSRSLSQNKDEAGYVEKFNALLKKCPGIVNQVFADKAIFGTSLESTVLLKACQYGRPGLVRAIVTHPGFDPSIVCRGTDTQGILALCETVSELVDPRTSVVRHDASKEIHFDLGLRIIGILVGEAHIDPHATIKVPGSSFEAVDADAYAAIPIGAGLSDEQRAQVREVLDAYAPIPEATPEPAPAPASSSGIAGCCTAFWSGVMRCFSCASVTEPEAATS